MTPAFLVRLMSFTPLSRGIKIGPEDREALVFANALRAASLEGRLAAVWLHPANELAGVTRSTPTGHRPLPQAALARALGLIKGASDYVFSWRGGAAALEFKSATGSLSQGQRDFREWCAAIGIPFHVVRNTGEALALLTEWGVYWEGGRA